MDPNNKAQQLKDFKETKRIVESFREQSYRQLMAPKPTGEGQVAVKVAPSLEIKTIQEAIARNDFTYPRFIIDNLAKIDPANPNYSALQRAQYFTFDQFEAAINSILNNSDYYKKLDEKIEELSKDNVETVEVVSNEPEAVQEAKGSTPEETELPQTDPSGLPSMTAGAGLGGMEASFRRNPTFVRQTPRPMAERKNELLDFKKQAAAQRQSLSPQETALQNKAVVQKRVDRVKGLYENRAVKREAMQGRTQPPTTTNRPFARASQPGATARERIANSTRRAGRGLGTVVQSSTARNLESSAARGFKVMSTRGAIGAGGFLGDLGKQFGGLLGGLGGGGSAGGGGLVNFSNIGRNLAQRGRGFIGGGGGTGGAASKNGERRVILWLLLLLAFLIFFGMMNSSTPAGPGEIELNKSAAPMVIPNGEGTSFQITVRNKATTGTADVEVTDSVPEGTTYVANSADNQPVFQPADNPKKLTWTLRGVRAGSTKIISFAVRANPDKKDFWIVNEASYKVLSSTGGGGGGTGVTGGTLSPADALEQDRALQAVIGGQGRNVTVLGDENSFVQTVLKNGDKLGIDSQYEPYLHKIYQIAAQYNVNPVIILGTWGTEVGFSIKNQDHAFSCSGGGPAAGSSFDSQLDCSAATYSHWMKVFEDQNKDGVLGIDKVGGGGTCNYNDPMIYAMDWYGPICHAYDQNENYRPNMLKFYKTLTGQP